MPQTIELTDDNFADYFGLASVRALARRAPLDAEGEPVIAEKGELVTRLVEWVQGQERRAIRFSMNRHDAAVLLRLYHPAPPPA
jgi:hypothetical protein